jgi:SAM-dependent methyltransferase
LTAGFSRVDAQPDPAQLVAGMDQVAQWSAVRQLRAWERTQLAVTPGDRVLDVGCGPGDVAIELSAVVGPTGAVLGVDASEAMIDAARRRAAAAGSTAEFRVADARSLTIDDGAFDACRTERMLQWVPDIDRAAAELVRVLRPGGRLVVTDTDWRSFHIDRVEPDLVEAVRLAMQTLRGPGFDIGGRLLNLVRDLGLSDVRATAATHLWTRWSPLVDPGPTGFFPFRDSVAQMADLDLLDRVAADRLVEQVEEAGRLDRFCMSVTMYAVYGRRPADLG